VCDIRRLAIRTLVVQSDSHAPEWFANILSSLQNIVPRRQSAAFKPGP
jgi:hypothetical protein